MELTFLGSGHAYESPNSDCACDTCRAQRDSGNYNDIRTNSSIAIREKGLGSLLIDVGPDFKRQKPRFRSFLNKPAGEYIGEELNILLTHPHYDHIGGLPELDSAVRGKRSIPTYAHPECFDTLVDKLDYGYLFKFGTLTRNNLEMGKNYTIGGFNVRAFPVNHFSKFAPGAVGFVIDSQSRRIVYTGDFGEIGNLDKIAADGRSIDVFISEANWFNKLEGRKDHANLPLIMDYLKVLNPAEVILTHLGSDDELTCEADSHFGFKKRPVNALLPETPRTHEELDFAVRVVFNRNNLAKYAAQKVILAYDGLIR